MSLGGGFGLFLISFWVLSYFLFSSNLMRRFVDGFCGGYFFEKERLLFWMYLITSLEDSDSLRDRLLGLDLCLSY